MTVENETDLAAHDRLVERVKRLVEEFYRAQAGPDGSGPQRGAMPAAPPPVRVR